MAEEKLFEEKIKKYLKHKGAWVVKIWGGGFQSAGIPDLLVCYKGLFIAIEVKATRGRPSDLQKYNIEKIQEAGGYGIILYPKDFEEFKRFIDGL